MHYLIAVCCLLLSYGFAAGFSDSNGKLVEDLFLRYTVLKQEVCPLESWSDLIERCEVPVDGRMVPADDNMVWFPKHSVCHLKESNPKVDNCIMCRGGSWETSSCAPGASREKRFFWFAVGAAVACVFFCGGGSGGGSGGSTSDYRPPSFSRCDKPSSTVFYADRAKTSTIVTWPQPTAKDGSGNNISPKLITGNGSPGSEFEKGFHTFEYKATDSKGFSDFCFISFEVRVRTCTHNWIRHGYVKSNNSNNYIFGTTCQVACDDGYDLHGASDLTCEENGWDHPIPTCKPKQCPALSDRFQCTDNNNFGSICSLSCDRSKGLSVTNPSITICLMTGKWYQPMPQCVDDSSPVFDNCPTQSIVVYADKGLETATLAWGNITATDNSGVVTVSQVEGQSSGSVFSKGSSVITYKATDREGNEAICSFNAIVQVLTCGPPPYTDNKMRFDCTNQYVYGSACSIKCVGALLNGSNSITCEKDNAIPPRMHWKTNTSQPPYCWQNNCDNLTTPANGALTCDTNSYAYFCVISCNTNWDTAITAPSNGMYTCGWTSGKWFPTGTVPDCTVRRPPRAMRLPSEFHYYTGDCNDPATQDQIKRHHISVLNSSVSIHQSGCISVGLCSMEDVEVRCGRTTRRKRDIMKKSVADDLNFGVRRQKRSENTVIVSWNYAVKYVCKNMSTTECLTYYENILNGLKNTTEQMLVRGDFKPTIPGVTVRNNSYYYGYVTLQCGGGLTPVTSRGSCAACPTGTVYNRTSESCSDCPDGTYQDEDHSISCKDCPQGTTTLSSGARSSSECKDMCQPGNLSATGIEPCTPCPVGRYQPSVSSMSCLSCPLGTTTQTTGVSSAAGCQSYDLEIQGPSQMTTSRTITKDIYSFTLFFWMKINSVSPGFTIAFTNDQVKVQIDNTLNVTLQGNPPRAGGHMTVGKWVAVTLVFDYSSKVLTLYKGKQVVFSTTFPLITSPVILSTSTLGINCSNTEGVTIRALSFIKTSKTSSEVAALSSTCDVTTDSNTVMTLDDIAGDSSQKVTVITPSSCDAEDECETSDPCNGHPCINTPGSYTCSCQDGYTGSDCLTPPDFCVRNRCENEAICVSGQTNYTCTCPMGFKGRLCEIKIVHGGYTNWTDWSSCPVSCGGGVETRFRTCDNPPPDLDGKPCTGPNLDSRPCNTEPCPVCRSSQLQHGANNSDNGPDCDGNDSELQCMVVCKPGHYLSRDQVSDYNCSNGQWKPATQLPACLEVISPKELRLITKVNYTTPGCLSKKEKEGLKMALTEKIRTLECEKLPSCDAKIDITDCSEASGVTTANITWTVVLSEGELDLESFTITKTMSPELKVVVEGTQTLENTAKQLQNESADIFEVTSGGVTYTPRSGATISADVNCPLGYFAEDGFCGPCPTGTRYDSSSRRCEFCEKGWYQDTVGQIECKQCPGGSSTKYSGTIEVSLCNVTVTAAPVSSTTTAATTITTSTTTTTASTVTVASVSSTTTTTTTPTTPTSTSVTVTAISSTATTASTVTVAPVSSTSTTTSTTTTTTTTVPTVTVASTSTPIASTTHASTNTTPTKVSPVQSATLGGPVSSTQVIIIVSSVLGTLLVAAVAVVVVMCLRRSSGAKAKRQASVKYHNNHNNHDNHHHHNTQPGVSNTVVYSRTQPPETNIDDGFATIQAQVLKNENPYATSTNIYNSIYDELDLPTRNAYCHHMKNYNYVPYSDPPPSYHEVSTRQSLPKDDIDHYIHPVVQTPETDREVAYTTIQDQTIKNEKPFGVSDDICNSVCDDRGLRTADPYYSCNEKRTSKC